MIPIRNIARSAALLAFASFTLAACGDDATGPKGPAAGAARLAISGDADTSFTGQAAFGVGDSGEGKVFGLVVGSEEIGVVLVRAGDRPAAGTYNVADATDETEDPASDFGAMLISETTEGSGFFVSRSGSVKITSSSAGSVGGSFTMVMDGILQAPGEANGTEGTITVSGTFNANQSTGEMTVRGARILAFEKK